MTPPRLCAAFLCVLLVLTLTAARGDLVQANFSAANPLKVMAVGDSITDDCVYNGAWRQYLQPLLETNGYAFTFVGRQSSAPSGSFTKILHEGYCGAVIALPGVFGAHQYSTTENYLQKIIPEALTNATPDLVLVLIGANDIGRGRNPGTLATNDMTVLLNLIFSNTPNANVLLAKISTMQGANNIGGLNYGAYANNVSIYNAYLQGVVNERRAAGQNVFLADMFSGVDSATMLISDHLHPNAIGLQVMAGEWLTRIQALSVQSNAVVSVLVKGGDNWKYFDGGVDWGTNWTRPDFDDSGWSNGPARFGFGDKVFATAIGYGSSTNKFPTTYLRRSIVVPANVTFTNLVLRLAQRGGSVVWLNGQELWRTNLPTGPIAYTNLALPYSSSFDGPYQFNAIKVDAAKLLPGTNVLAEELHLLSPSIASAGFDLELIGRGFRVPPSLSLTQSGTNLVFAWSADSGGFRLYSSTNLGATNWISNITALQTNAGQLVVTQAIENGAKFFRLQKP